LALFGSICFSILFNVSEIENKAINDLLSFHKEYIQKKYWVYEFRISAKKK
jgi:hypothetical protein